LLFEQITVSAGVRGCQLLLSPTPLIEYVEATVCDLISM
jgi:Cys-tRNA(Pro)/Cys-tRNA(Cys) deacylase